MREEHDSHKIGSPRKLSEILQLTSASTPRRPPEPSEITGTVLPGPGAARLTGPQRGGTGVAVTPTRNPLQVFRLGPSQDAARLGLLLAPLLEWREDSRYENGQFEGIDVVGLRLREGAVVPEAAREMLDRICGPCDPTFAAQKLAELRALTVSRKRDDDDVELMAVAFTQRLAEFPQDVVNAAVDAWANREQFWPSWSELKAECDKRMMGRLRLRMAIGS